MENENLYMGYLSKKQLKDEFSGLLGGISALGIAMSGVIAFIGILNFINSFRYFSEDYFADMCVQAQALEKWQYVRRVRGYVSETGNSLWMEQELMGRIRGISV